MLTFVNILFLGVLGIIGAVVTAFLAVAKEVADVRKDLGVSVTTAGKLAIQTRILGLQAKAYGLDVEDIKEAQAAIRNDLGASAGVLYYQLESGDFTATKKMIVVE